jgi:peroxiredoxin
MALLKSQQTLATGSSAPNFSLPGVDGNLYSLNSFKDVKAFLVIFMCNHCPYVIPKIKVMKNLQLQFKSRGLQVIGVNANDVINYPDDNPEAMKKFAEENNLNFPYLFDASQEVPKAYGAVCTPDPFLFDANKKLVYHGRFDDALSPEETPTTFDMADAIDAVLDGKKPEKDFLPSMGCSIKWK